MRKLLYLLIGVAFLFSCTDSSIYNSSFHFDNNTWKQKIKPKFTVHIKDTSLTYDFTLSFRTTTDYKFSNIWIYLTTKTPFKQVIREPYEIKTCYPNGEWVGTKTGSMVEHKLVFRRRKLPQIGKYTFIIEQGVVQKALNELVDITFDVSKVEE